MTVMAVTKAGGDLKRFKNLNCDVVFKYDVDEPDRYSIEFAIYRHIAWEGPEFDKPMYEVKGTCGIPTAELSEAQVFAHGYVKWDGCTNFDFDAAETTMLHACDREDLEWIGTILSRVWDECHRRMPSHSFTHHTSIVPSQVVPDPEKLYPDGWPVRVDDAFATALFESDMDGAPGMPAFGDLEEWQRDEYRRQAEVARKFLELERRKSDQG